MGKEEKKCELEKLEIKTRALPPRSLRCYKVQLGWGLFSSRGKSGFMTPNWQLHWLCWHGHVQHSNIVNILSSLERVTKTPTFCDFVASTEKRIKDTFSHLWRPLKQSSVKRLCRLISHFSHFPNSLFQLYLLLNYIVIVAIFLPFKWDDHLLGQIWLKMWVCEMRKVADKVT